MRAAIVVVILCWAGPAFAQAVTDERVWLGAGVDAGLGPRLRFSAEQQLRLGAGVGFDETHTELKAQYRILDMLRVGVLYRLAFTDVDTRNRIGAEVKLQGTYKMITGSYRLRLQDTTRPSQNSDQVMLRNRLKVDIEATKRVTPFASIELHHQLSPVAEYRKFRLTLGVAWELTKKIELDGYYLFETESNVNMPQTNHILGLELIYHLGNLRHKEKGTGGDD